MKPGQLADQTMAVRHEVGELDVEVPVKPGDRVRGELEAP